MSDFSTGRINSSGQLVYADTSDTLGIPNPSNTTSSQPPTVQAIGIIQGFNLGDGLGLYTSIQTSGRVLSGFKSLIAGSGVALTADDTSITINSNFTNVLSQLSFTSLGSGSSTFVQKIAGDVQLRSLTGSGIIAVQQDDEQITISGAAVTSVGLTASSDFVVTGSPVTSVGSIGLALADTGVSAGSYTNTSLTIDSKGRVTAISNGSTTTVAVQAGAGVSVSPGPNYTVGLTATGVAQGAYTAPSLVIDANGRITAAASNSIPNPVTAVNAGSGIGQPFMSITNQALSFRTIAGAGAITVAQTADTITISSPTSGTVTSVAATGAGGITVTGGPINTSGTFTVSLGNTAVTAGNYVAPSLTVDATGRITSATSNALGEVATAANLTGGYGLFAQKSGTVFQFRTLVAGDGIAISSNANNVVVAASATTAANLTAVGSTQSTALPLTSDWNEVLTSASGTGVAITQGAGTQVFIANYSANSIFVYPPVGGAINGLAVNVGYSLPIASTAVARIMSSTKIYI